MSDPAHTQKETDGTNDRITPPAMASNNNEGAMASQLTDTAGGVPSVSTVNRDRQLLFVVVVSGMQLTIA